MFDVLFPIIVDLEEKTKIETTIGSNSHFGVMRWIHAWERGRLARKIMLFLVRMRAGRPRSQEIELQNANC